MGAGERKKAGRGLSSIYDYYCSIITEPSQQTPRDLSFGSAQGWGREIGSGQRGSYRPLAVGSEKTARSLCSDAQKIPIQSHSFPHQHTRNQLRNRPWSGGCPGFRLANWRLHHVHLPIPSTASDTSRPGLDHPQPESNSVYNGHLVVRKR